MYTFIGEFKTFAMRGNVVDLAVAVVIGAAFGKIISSLVDNLITPFLELFLGGIDFSNLSFTAGGAMFTYGVFIQSVINFLIIAFVVFVVVKAMNSIARREKHEENVTPSEPPEDVRLLREIRDALKR